MKDINDSINKAMQDGQFNDLPGKGKPLNLDKNPFADPEWELAYHMLKNGGFTLPWIEARQQIENGLEEARTELKRAWEWQRVRAAQKMTLAQVEQHWQQSLSAFRERILTLIRKSAIITCRHLQIAFTC
jgi:hypothetical protein